MHKGDLVRVRHMLDAAREALAFTRHQSRRALDDNRMLALSLIRCVEVVGEAATHVSSEFQHAHPEVPWSQIVAMRNRLIHAYFDVDLDRLWDTVADDLPPLVATLERVVAGEL